MASTKVNAIYPLQVASGFGKNKTKKVTRTFESTNRPKEVDKSTNKVFVIENLSALCFPSPLLRLLLASQPSCREQDRDG